MNKRQKKKLFKQILIKVRKLHPQKGDVICFQPDLNWIDVETMLLSFKLDAPSPCRLDAPDLDLICYASADCLHQHLQVI